jgi:homoserine O-acetyltransferase
LELFAALPQVGRALSVRLPSGRGEYAPCQRRAAIAAAAQGRNAMKTIRRLGHALVATLLAYAATASAHWPDQPPHQFADLGEFEFEGGGKIPNLRMSYVTHGKLNAAKDNAILFQHGFAANHHLFDHMIGPGRPLDTDKYFIICPDSLGASQTTFEHSSSPTNSGLKMKFPRYNERDIVNAQYRLLTEALGIERLLAVTGISSGGRQSLQFAVSHPSFMGGIFPIVGGTPFMAQGALMGSQMTSVIESCKGWEGGDYEENPKGCAATALSELIPYFYTRDWWEQNVDTPEAYTRWRNTWGAYYLDIQDARDVYYRTMAGNWVGDTPGFNGNLQAVLNSIKAKTLFILSPQDLFLPPQHVDAFVRNIPDARVVWIDSPAGHLICCNADPNATRKMDVAIRGFLRELDERRKHAEGRN